VCMSNSQSDAFEEREGVGILQEDRNIVYIISYPCPMRFSRGPVASRNRLNFPMILLAISFDRFWIAHSILEFSAMKKRLRIMLHDLPS